MHTRQKVTIKDVARVAGVSYGTVTRVLNNQPGVSEQARRRVEDAIQKTHYAVNPIAKALRARRTHTIGLYIPPPPERVIHDENAHGLFAGVFLQAASLGYNVLHLPALSLDQTEPDSIGLALCEGIIAMGLESKGDLFHGLPYVAVNREPSPPYGIAVHVNHFQAAYDLTDYLINCGHKRLAFIGFGGYVTVERRKGFCAALADHGLSPDEELYCPDYSQGRSANLKRLLELTNPPTAIFCIGDWLALHVLDSLKEMGLRVPDDISLASIDGNRSGSLVTPPLTTVTIPWHEIGAIAVNMLCQRIANPETKQVDITVPHQLTIRGSVRNLNMTTCLTNQSAAGA